MKPWLSMVVTMQILVISLMKKKPYLDLSKKYITVKKETVLDDCIVVYEAMYDVYSKDVEITGNIMSEE